VVGGKSEGFSRRVLSGASSQLTNGSCRLPTFMVFKQGVSVEKIIGADKQKLDRVVRDLAAMAIEAGSSSGSLGGGVDWRKGELPKGYSDVSDQVDGNGFELLNADSEFGSVATLFENSKPSALNTKGKSAADGKVKDWVESDTDEQLMLFMPFRATLKVHTLQARS
jgi:PITH domain